MGYHTDFSLCITENKSKKTDKKIIKELREDCGIASDAFDKDGDNTCDALWLDHEEDMAMFSRRNPEVVFELYGDGEGSEDMWYKYFKNGKMQFCPAVITFDGYDESKLVERGGG